jgi:hypothetical protein
VDDTKIGDITAWTLAELATLAARALADGQVRAASGRVTGLPDGRLIRWYTTIGLLDRPAIGPGRFARYGPRHLHQLVAVKRLQARGLPLAEIQARLAGATDAQLRRIAAVPPGLADSPAGGLADSPTGRFWTRPAAPASSAPVAAGPAASRAGASTTVDNAPVTRVHGLRLGGLTLLLPAEPAPDDLGDIAAAAGPLLDVLAGLGLLDPTEGASS